MAGAACARRGDEATSLKHLIRKAGTLRLPTEQVKRHPDVKPPRPSGSHHVKLSSGPESGAAIASEQNEIIHSSIQ